MRNFSQAFFSIGMIVAAVCAAIRGDHVVALLVLILRESIIIRSDMAMKGGK